MSSEALLAMEAAGTEKKDLSVLLAPEATDVVKEVLLAFSAVDNKKKQGYALLVSFIQKSVTLCDKRLLLLLLLSHRLVKLTEASHYWW